jgi:hypothetical protein
MSLTIEDLFSLEQYSNQRSEFRAKVFAHKKHRRLQIGEHIALYFESQLTMQYQIQEMLRIERIFEAEAIQEELDTYNPLIPDGNGWRATMMIEYVDPIERQQRLTEMAGLEDTLWFSTNVDGSNKIKPLVNPDLERSTEDKTSAVHFVFFNFTATEKAQILKAEVLTFGIDHPAYGPISATADKSLQQQLINDLANP